MCDAGHIPVLAQLKYYMTTYIHISALPTHVACAMPDTFQSWFLVAHLHIWLLLVRLKREGKEGTFMINQVVVTFWEDVEARMKELGVTSSMLISKNLRELLQQFYGFTLSYEEVKIILQ